MKKYILPVVVLLLLQAPSAVSFLWAAAPAETIRLLTARLETWNVEHVWPEVQEALAGYPQDADLIETAAYIAFYRGDYNEALNLAQKALEVGGEDEDRRGFARFVEGTIQVLAPYKRVETPHFIISLDEQRDGILVDYLVQALEKTYQVMFENYGFSPQEKVRVELFPDTKAFYLTSTLSVRDIEVTGAVGLTKFNKLQFLSPRALVHGYRWLDAISHEYMHYLIVKMTGNKAPIWFHEGLSKFEETRWRAGPGYLSPLYRTLLAQAQAEDRLIKFSRMEPSLIHLDTPEEVQLAYAQSASAIDFIIDRSGYEGLKSTMDRMAESPSEGAAEALRQVLGMEFFEFEKKWADFLAAKKLETVTGTAVKPYKVKEGKADDEYLDLQEIKSMVARNRAHLGDRLKQRGRPGAAVIEYRRALTEMQDSIPVMNRLTSVLIELNRDDEALKILNRTVDLAPDHPTPYRHMGRVYLKLKDFKQAKAAFEESIQINPFNPEVHVGLANAYARLGDNAGFAKERDIAYQLRR